MGGYLKPQKTAATGACAPCGCAARRPPCRCGPPPRLASAPCLSPRKNSPRSGMITKPHPCDYTVLCLDYKQSGMAQTAVVPCCGRICVCRNTNLRLRSCSTPTNFYERKEDGAKLCFDAALFFLTNEARPFAKKQTASPLSAFFTGSFFKCGPAPLARPFEISLSTMLSVCHFDPKYKVLAP